MVQFSTPVGTTLAETERVGNLIADYFLTKEKDNLNVIFMVMGRNNAGSGQNVGMAFAGLKHWDDREGSENTAEAVIARANSYFKSLRNARVQVLSPAAVRGLDNQVVLSFGYKMLKIKDVMLYWRHKTLF